ncbi:Uncharacterized protein CT_035 [Chlamydiales bacterium SCGC AB-751-O23]|jgi:glutamine amidotransferase-like uncharacterized protein|nr:Uncharacterized protein CT_035 [Chlamydiales bacterium SCGC AB-751-O23]
MSSSFNIGIYLDEGVSASSFFSLKDFCLKHTGMSVKKINAESIKANEISHLKWIFFPGGRDVFYHQKLKGEGCSILEEWVFNGGHYIGICAGAYFACEGIEFEKGYPLEVIEKRDLGFFPGTAIGPAYEKGIFDYHSNAGSSIAWLSLKEDENFQSFFKGGCYFSPRVKEGFEVLANYDNLDSKPIAVVLKKHGKGKVLLSGVHPEFSFQYIEKKHPDLLEKIKGKENFGHIFFSKILSYLA